MDNHWKKRIERAEFEADRAARQYAAVEPENRLVGRSLESCWETALRQKEQLEQEYARFRHQQPTEPTAAERDSIHRLSQDVPQLFDAPTTTAEDRQEMIRLLLDRVVVAVQGESEQVEVILHWQGEYTSSHGLVRPVARYEQLSNYAELVSRIDALRRNGHTLSETAEQLNNEGYHPPKRTGQFTGQMIGRFLRNLHPPKRRPLRAMSDPTLLKTDEYWLPDLSHQLNIPVDTLYRWQRLGWLHSRKVPISGGRWAIWANAEELARLQRLRRHKRTWPDPRYPIELTTPTPKSR